MFTSRGVIERKTDLVIQITPKIIQDAYTGIVKSKEVAEYEDYVTRSLLEKNETNESEPANDTNEETNGSEADQGKGE